MHFDDRLATVLRQPAMGERAVRTQYRQLLDLLGDPRGGTDRVLRSAAWLRLEALDRLIGAEERAAILREPGLRLRGAELIARLADSEPAVAAAAIQNAQLDTPGWERLIPVLPVRARGFLRLRKNLPPAIVDLLERLGIHDRGLPGPAAPSPSPHASGGAGALPRTPANDSDESDTVSDADPGAAPRESEIGALVKRIEAFRRSRDAAPAPDSPHLPLEELFPPEPDRIAAFGFTADASGRIDWAEGEAAPMIVGTVLTASDGAAPDLAVAFRRHQPIRRLRYELAGAPAIAGRWLVDAAPRFTPPDGRFTGYAGRFRRVMEDDAGSLAQANEAADRMRQLLHELKTPVNAIQGFAEVIQQQMFGPAPHEYRALAATIAGDAARMLSGFDDLDRLARLEASAAPPESGTCNFLAVLRPMVAQLQVSLRPRESGFEFDFGEAPARLPIALADAERLAWRLLATLAGATGANENLAMVGQAAKGHYHLRCALPAALVGEDDLFASTMRSSGTLSTGMFGAGFALRLARAEAAAAGGSLRRQGDTLHLTLPLATADTKAGPATGRQENAVMGA